MNLSISRLSFAELDNIRILQPEGWSDIIHPFRFYRTSDFCYPFKLIADNEIAGTGCAIILASPDILDRHPMS